MSLALDYQTNGYVAPVACIDGAAAARHRRQLEHVEQQFGDQHYRSKMHTLLDFAADLATAPRVLDVVEQLLGPNIMLFDVNLHHQGSPFSIPCQLASGSDLLGPVK